MKKLNIYKYVLKNKMNSLGDLNKYFLEILHLNEICTAVDEENNHKSNFVKLPETFIIIDQNYWINSP